MSRAALVLLALGGCDYRGEWLFANTTEIPPVIDLGEIEPIDVNSRDDVVGAAIYGELGASGTAEQGGATFSFRGTGGSVCVWVDPELVAWNQAVALTGANVEYSYPDNYFDDGDIDLFGGLTVYYNGSPGERVGDFAIRYDDSLGNEIAVQFNECTILDRDSLPGGHSGRSTVEYCTLRATQPDVGYTVLLQTFTTPLDDDRLAYGLLLMNGDCDTLKEQVFVDLGTPQAEECLILGEALDPSTTVVNDDGTIDYGDPYPGSEDFERSFCGIGDTPLPDFCALEAEQKDCGTEGVRCFCGDPASSPTGVVE